MGCAESRQSSDVDTFAIYPMNVGFAEGRAQRSRYSWVLRDHVSKPLSMEICLDETF